jgi:hypothetical protein
VPHPWPCFGFVDVGQQFDSIHANDTTLTCRFGHLPPLLQLGAQLLDLRAVLRHPLVVERAVQRFVHLRLRQPAHHNPLDELIEHLLGHQTCTAA